MRHRITPPSHNFAYLQIYLHTASYFFDKEGVIEEFERFLAVRLQGESLQPAVDRTFRDACGSRQGASCPLRAAVCGLALQGPVDPGLLQSVSQGPSRHRGSCKPGLRLVAWPQPCAQSQHFSRHRP